jgi:hypothetical protein
MLHSAMEILFKGEKPDFKVWSNYDSGCYTPWPDRDVEREHDSIVNAINEMV